jgi:hypothetical protein
MSGSRQRPYDFLREKPADWFGTDTQTNATATASAPAGSANVQQQLCSIHASLSATGTALLQIKDGATVIWQRSITATTPVDFTFKNPLKVTLGNQITAVLAAGGSAVVGNVAITGFSETAAD